MGWDLIFQIDEIIYKKGEIQKIRVRFLMADFINEAGYGQITKG